MGNGRSHSTLVGGIKGDQVSKSAAHAHTPHDYGFRVGDLLVSECYLHVVVGGNVFSEEKTLYPRWPVHGFYFRENRKREPHWERIRVSLLSYDKKRVWR